MAKTKRRKVWVTFDGETLRRVIAGEPARTAAAVAAAREEQREACALHVASANPGAYTAGEYAEDVRAAPLTATPLADRIAELSRTLQARVEDWNNERTTVVMERRRANDLEAERDALRAQAEAARALCEPFRSLTHMATRYGAAMRDILAAMDGAKTK